MVGRVVVGVVVCDDGCVALCYWAVPYLPDTAELAQVEIN